MNQNNHHKVRVIPTEETHAERSSKYEFIDFGNIEVTYEEVKPENQ